MPARPPVIDYPIRLERADGSDAARRAETARRPAAVREPGEHRVTHVTIRRLSAAWLAAAGLATGAAGPADAQPLDAEAQEREVVSLANVVGAALRGEIVPTEDPFGWANDFLKSSEGTTFIPFTLSIEESKLTTPAVAMYLFVAPRGGASPVSSAAFEDGYHVLLGAAGEDGLYRIRRGFWVPAGDYDVYVALSESEVEAGAAPATMMLRRTLSVPDLWTAGFATSSVIVAEGIESLNAPPPPEQLPANPYTLGTMRIAPKSTREYVTSDELSMLFLVYNAGLTASGMPDVTVQYAFHVRGDAGEEFFNETNPQAFNERTLPQGFDVGAGHQLVAGQAVPLSSFPPAEYRLEITVTDNTSGESLTHDVGFSVVEAAES